MKQIALIAPFTFQFNEIEIPTIKENEVLLKINQIGICASDMQMFHGQHKYMKFPIVFGHEVAATIVEVGKQVNDYKIGDRVTVEPQVFCGECYPCKTGHFNVCQNLRVLGVHKDGFACEYFAIEPKYLHNCNELTDDQTAMMEPLAVGISSARRGNVAGKNVAIVGSGIIGNLVAQSAIAQGAEKVLITDIKDSKLEFARKAGIEYTFNTSNKSLKDAINDIFGYRKADVIIDCAANKASFNSIIEAARPRSTIVITGNYKTPVEFEVPLVQRQEIDLIGHMMYQREDFADGIRYIKEGIIKIDSFATQHNNISTVAESFDFIDKNPDLVMKSMLMMDN